MIIRKSTPADLASVMEIYAYARGYMKSHGNPSQWQDNHPPIEMIEKDIESERSYVCIDGNKIVAVFYFNIEDDPTYNKIDGKWLSDAPYGVVHRIARGPDAKGAGSFCLNWCYNRYPNIRIDTHKDNTPMLKMLEKQGFTHCGTIWLENGDERMAFQKK